MATGKKSFILYSDLIHTAEKLPDNKAGVLFKTILRYVNDQNPEVKDMVVAIAFEPVKLQLKRDLKEWEEISKKRSEAGRKGGLKKAEAKEAQHTNIEQIKQLLPNESKVKQSLHDNGTDNVTVTDTVINDIGERKLKFAQTVREFGQYPEAMLEAFIDYWTEAGEKAKKFRQEKQTSWELGKRLKRWAINNKISGKIIPIKPNDENGLPPVQEIAR